MREATGSQVGGVQSARRIRIIQKQNKNYDHMIRVCAKTTVYNLNLIDWARSHW
jgi:hypothetical protein